jgi:hypothetical protein
MQFKKIPELNRRICVDKIFSIMRIKNIHELFTNFLIENNIKLYGSSLLCSLSKKKFAVVDIDLVCEYLEPVELKFVCEQLTHIIYCEVEYDTQDINVVFSNKKEKIKKMEGMDIYVTKASDINNFNSNNIYCIIDFVLSDFVLSDTVMNVQCKKIQLVVLNKNISSIDYILKSDFSVLQNYFDGIDIFICENIKNIENMYSLYFLESERFDGHISPRNLKRLKKYRHRGIILSKIYYKKTGEIFHVHNEKYKIKKNVKNLCIFLNEISLNKIIEKYDRLELLIIYKNNSSLVIDNLPCSIKKINIYIFDKLFYSNIFTYEEENYFNEETNYFVDKETNCEIKIKIPFGCVYLLNDIFL